METDTREESHKSAKLPAHTNFDNSDNENGSSKYVIFATAVALCVVAIVIAVFLGLIIWHSKVTKSEVSNDRHEKVEETQQNTATRIETQ